MGKFWRQAGALALVAALALPAEALYQFDDLYGPSGVGAQWMVITGGYDTLGDTADAARGGTGLDASGDIVSDRNSVEVVNGRSTSAFDRDSNRDIHTLFLVLPAAQGNLTVNLSSSAPDAVTPDALVDNAVYAVQKTPAGTPTGKTYYDRSWKQHQLQFVKRKNPGVYESVRGNFLFHQNPGSAYPSTPSQTLQVPFVIANVYNGTAADEPLQVNAALRDNTTSVQGNIVACDRFKWDVTDDMTTGGNQWVFVPVESWPVNDERIHYTLTTEVTNHTAVRYAVQRYDQHAWAHQNPAFWKFDLPRTPNQRDVPPRFQLDEKSHIAPGLTAVYRQRYNVNQGEKTPLRLYPVDPAAGFRSLTLNHQIIFGVDLGSVEADTGSGGTTQAAPYRVQAFNPRAASTTFLENVAKAMSSRDRAVPLEVKVPEARLLNVGSVKYDYVAGDVLNSFSVNLKVPANLRRTGTEGMLPLHVTFNLPRTNLYVSRHWDSLLEQWHETGDVHDEFAQAFSVYLLSRRKGEPDNPWDMVQEMIKRGAYDSQVKVFMDEDRGVVTVSFIAMLMDGTRDGARPALYLVPDQTATTSNTFMILRDGLKDDAWNLTFYVAPAEYVDNDRPGQGPTQPKDGKGSGGGCDAAGPGLLFGALAALGAALRRRGRRG